MINFSTPSAFLEKINQWFNGLIALPILAVSYGYLEIHSGRFNGIVMINLYQEFVLIIPILFAAVVYTRRYRKQVGRIFLDKPLNERVKEYFRFSKSYYLIMFLLGMLTTICIFVFGSTSFAGLYAFQLFILSIHRPTLLSVANKLNLKGDIRSDFLKKNIFTN
ncbi:MAG: hypothetical protein KDC79_14785 [Cyclobacteriaceae bacterium]|nr:hypothetical protein [Cyclobacteriaceae bacterium]